MFSKTIICVGTILFAAFVFCEYLIYYVFLYQCLWPNVQMNVSDENIPVEKLKAVFIADTHLLGVRKGHWFDKLRREWQMYRSFQTILTLHNPEIIFILGDVYDEASFSYDNVYNQYVNRFFELFKVRNSTELFVVAGNHDIGFHYAMHPHLEYRFRKTMNAPSVRLISRKNNHFILINSMALEQDGCNICSNAETEIKRLSYTFLCANVTLKCSKTEISKYSRPIILMHFPLYRKNDANCSGSDSAPNSEKFTEFKEKWDCLSKTATNYLLDALHPRVVFTGHTHHGCLTRHRSDIFEYTVPSFNWRNKFNPAFILSTISIDDYATYTCHLPNEFVVIGLYILAVTFSLISILRTYKYHNHIKYLKKQ